MTCARATREADADDGGGVRRRGAGLEHCGESGNEEDYVIACGEGMVEGITNGKWMLMGRRRGCVSEGRGELA